MASVRLTPPLRQLIQQFLSCNQSLSGDESQINHTAFDWRQALERDSVTCAELRELHRIISAVEKSLSLAELLRGSHFVFQTTGVAGPGEVRTAPFVFHFVY